METSFLTIGNLICDSSKFLIRNKSYMNNIYIKIFKNFYEYSIKQLSIRLNI